MEQSSHKPVTVAEALKVLPISREGFYRKLKSGKLPCWRFGKKILVDVEEILGFMKQKCKAPLGRNPKEANSITQRRNQ